LFFCNVSNAFISNINIRKIDPINMCNKNTLRIEKGILSRYQVIRKVNYDTVLINISQINNIYIP
jgi:hypothetical protein